MNHVFVNHPWGKDICDAKLDDNGRVSTCGKKRAEHEVKAVARCPTCKQPLPTHDHFQIAQRAPGRVTEITADISFSNTACRLDTDGDGNCPLHPHGCPRVPYNDGGANMGAGTAGFP